MRESLVPNVEALPQSVDAKQSAQDRREMANKEIGQQAGKLGNALKDAGSAAVGIFKGMGEKVKADAEIARNGGKLDATKDAGAPEKKDTPKSTAESREKTPEQKFADTKQTELQKREGEKYDKATKEWGTIPNGITDSKGQPFLYKQDAVSVGGEKKPALVAFSPDGKLQYLVQGTTEWKHADDSKNPDGAAITKQFGSVAKDYQGTIDTQRSKDPAAYDKFMTQQKRNGGAEAFIKDKATGPKDFHTEADHWTGNEKMRDALKNGKDGKPKEDGSGEKDGQKPNEQNGSGTEKRDAEKREAGSDKKTEDKEQSKEADKKRPTEKEVSEAQKVLDKKDATSAERAEAIKTLTEAKLNELDGKSGSEKGEKPTDEPKKPDAPKKKAPEVLKSVETEKEQRTRLMVEVRNAKPMKKVEEVVADKNKEFDDKSKLLDERIDATEKKMETQGEIIKTLGADISNLRQENAKLPAEERGKIDTKITVLETQLAIEKTLLDSLIKNHDAAVKTLKILRDALDSDIRMLDTMKKETEQLAKRTEEKIKDMGKELIGLGNDFVGILARDGIDVRHDESLGLSVKPSAKLSDFLKNILPSSVMNSLTTDNPLPLLGGLQSVLEGVKKEAQKKRIA